MNLLSNLLVVVAGCLPLVYAQAGCCSLWWLCPPNSVITRHTIFELNTSNGEWNDPWDLEPGTVGTAAGEKHGSGGVTVAFPKQGPLTDVIFEIELQQNAKWDFGPMTFKHITLEANSTDTSWCNNPVLGSYKFKYKMSTPQVSVSGGTSRCYISQLVFESP